MKQTAFKSTAHLWNSCGLRVAGRLKQPRKRTPARTSPSMRSGF
ncbi:hypothetical protein [Listeria booriae]|nr:hypothetical protein [Listeria booriae]